MRTTRRARGYAALIVATALAVAGITATTGGTHHTISRPVSNGHDNGPEGSPSPSPT
ncbi:MAG TPA: hypothetical protein VKB69_08715 [Micromonosporaceae bacterium]|nr:hypothetical protein [Micromonosporaceae bacterium]